MSISSFPTITSSPFSQQQQEQQEAGPSHPQRYLYFAVRRGTKPGVYVDWYQAEKQLINHPDPSVKTFSTRLAAEAFVAGWDGAGRHALPPTTPRPLRDHLAMSFPGAVNGAHPTTRRQSYHARLLASIPPPSDLDLDSEFGTLAQHQDAERPTRPPSQSFRHSMVKISSPLRQEVDGDPIEELDTSSSRLPQLHKAASYIGMGGLLSPPTSPDKSTKRLSVMERERPTKARGVSESGQWSSRGHRDFVTGTGTGLGLLSPPNSPPSVALDKRTSTSGRPRPPSRASGLWADVTPAPEPKPSIPGAELFGDNTAPKFSRSSLRKSGVVMPVAATSTAKRTSSSNLKSLHSNPSRSSLYSNASSSSSSLASNSSVGSNKAWGRHSQSQAQDRLSSLAENSRREMQSGDDEDLLSLPPPRPAFMKRTPSQASIASNESTGSMGSMTSGSSAPSSSMEFSTEPEHIVEEEEKEDVMISCTKSDGDADGSVDSGSMKNYKNTNKKSGMGMLKRFAKALKIDKKSIDSRRGSL